MATKNFKEKNEVFFIFLQDALNQTIDNKKNLNEKANKLITLYFTLLTLVITIFSFFIKNTGEIFNKIGIILYLTPITLCIYIGIYFTFNVLQVKDGFLIANPKDFKQSVYNKQIETWTIQKEINDHYVDLIDLLKSENLQNGVSLKIASKLFKKILYSVPIGLVLFFFDSLKEKSYSDIKIGFAVVYISVFIVLIILDLNNKYKGVQ